MDSSDFFFFDSRQDKIHTFLKYPNSWNMTQTYVLFFDFPVVASARCIFGTGAQQLFSPVTFLSSTTLVCVAPRLCIWTTDGTAGQSPLNSISGAMRNVTVQPPLRGTLCIFPFIYRQKLYTSCQTATSVPGFLQDFGQNLTAAALNALVNGTGFCSVTANLTADRGWGVCECRGPATGGAPGGPRPSTGAWSFGVAFNGFFVRKMSEGSAR